MYLSIFFFLSYLCASFFCYSHFLVPSVAIENHQYLLILSSMYVLPGGEKGDMGGSILCQGRRWGVDCMKKRKKERKKKREREREREKERERVTILGTNFIKRHSTTPFPLSLFTRINNGICENEYKGCCSLLGRSHKYAWKKTHTRGILHVVSTAEH